MCPSSKLHGWVTWLVSCIPLQFVSQLVPVSIAVIHIVYHYLKFMQIWSVLCETLLYQDVGTIVLIFTLCVIQSVVFQGTSGTDSSTPTYKTATSKWSIKSSTCSSTCSAALLKHTPDRWVDFFNDCTRYCQHN